MSAAAAPAEAVVQLPGADEVGSHAAPRWFLDVDEVHVVTVRASSSVVDVVVERGGPMWTGVHARRGRLTADQAERLALCLLAAAAAARGTAS